MIEEIKLLLPLLEGVANGSLYVIFVYFGWVLIKMLIITFSIIFVCIKVIEMIIYLNKDSLSDMCIDKNVEGRILLLLSRFKSNAYIHRSSVEEIEELLTKNK